MIALIVLGVIVVAVVAALVFVMRWGMRAKDEASRAADMYREQERRADMMQQERDVTQAKLDVEIQSLGVAKVRLATAEKQRNEAGRIAVDQLVTTIKGSDAQAAIDAIGGLLRMPLGPVPKADPAGASDSDRGAAGVQPPRPPGTVR